MKDAERLDLLKEIGGTRVYEERRRESLKIMYETGKSQLSEPSLAYCPYCKKRMCLRFFWPYDIFSLVTR